MIKGFGCDAAQAGGLGRKCLMLLASLALALAVAACGGSQSKDFDADNSNANIKKGVKPEADAEAAVIDTDFGKIVMELYPNVAPQMVARFKQLAREGFYNGTTFHRISPQTGVVQGGDPKSKDEDTSDDGSGNSPYPNVPAEFSDIPFDRGIVGAARTSDPNSANCQFYITLKRVPFWDGQYTVFGRVIEGMNNADIIAGAPVRPGSEQPQEKIVIRSITLQPRANFK